MQAETVNKRLGSPLHALLHLYLRRKLTTESHVGSLDVVDATSEKNVDIVTVQSAM